MAERRSSAKRFGLVKRRAQQRLGPQFRVGARGRRGPVEVKGLGNKKMVGRDKKLLSRVKRAY